MGRPAQVRVNPLLPTTSWVSPDTQLQLGRQYTCVSLSPVSVVPIDATHGCRGQQGTFCFTTTVWLLQH